MTYRDAQGAERQAFADGEVIVAAGALVTPQLLMLSGLGPAEQLAAHGIQTLVDLPGVGAESGRPSRGADRGRGERALRLLPAGRRLAHAPQRPAVQAVRHVAASLSSGVEAGAFVNPTDPEAEPSIQAFCVPVVYLDRDAKGLVEDGYGLTVTTVVAKPRSRGSVRLRSPDPAAMPLVSPGLLSDPADLRAMIDGQRFFLRAFQTQPLADRVARIAIPDPGDLGDEALANHCRRFVKTNYHPAGTCRMGAAADPLAVLDSRLRVRGIERLRVCDLSAMPNINAGNTAAPAMMMGSRCAEFILQPDAASG